MTLKILITLKLLCYICADSEILNISPKLLELNGVKDDGAPASLPFPMTAAEESLRNLSAAITQRQQSENGPESFESTGSSLPSLVDRISDVQGLVEKYRRMQHQKR